MTRFAYHEFEDEMARLEQLEAERLEGHWPAVEWTSGNPRVCLGDALARDLLKTGGAPVERTLTSTRPQE